MWKEYQERNTLLVQLGYATYEEYLQGELWYTIRRRVYKRDGNRCCLCKKKGEEIHHLSYSRDVLLGYDLAPLKVLCEICHRKVEFKRDGSKRSFAETTKTFQRYYKKPTNQLRLKLRRFRKGKRGR